MRLLHKWLRGLLGFLLQDLLLLESWLTWRGLGKARRGCGRSEERERGEGGKGGRLEHGGKMCGE